MGPLSISLLVALVAAPMPGGATDSPPVCDFVHHGVGAEVVTDAQYGLAFDVILPDGYEEEAERSFAAVYALHSRAADAEGCAATIEEIKAAKADFGAETAIVVVVRGRGAQIGSEWNHGPPWPVSQIWKLVPYIDAKYRVVQDRRYQFISGYTLGTVVGAVLPAAP